jgi:hypothetical protein
MTTSRAERIATFSAGLYDIIRLNNIDIEGASVEYLIDAYLALRDDAMSSRR